MSEDDDKKLPAIQNRIIGGAVEIDQKAIFWPFSTLAGPLDLSTVPSVLGDATIPRRPRFRGGRIAIFKLD